MAWIGVDLDGTLAKRNGGIGRPIGDPVPAMVARVKGWTEAGREVRVFTVRAYTKTERERVEKWLKDHGLPKLKVTNIKDPGMAELWDDRAVRVEVDTGEICPACADYSPEYAPAFTASHTQAKPAGQWEQLTSAIEGIAKRQAEFSKLVERELER